MACINNVTVAGTIREPNFTPNGGHCLLEVDRYVHNEGFVKFKIPVLVTPIQDKHSDSWQKSWQYLKEGDGCFIEGKLEATAKGTIVVRGKPKSTFFGDIKPKGGGGNNGGGESYGAGDYEDSAPF